MLLISVKITPSSMPQDNTALSINFTEELYKLYLQNPNNVEPSWREYFSECQDFSGGQAKPEEEGGLKSVMTKSAAPTGNHAISRPDLNAAAFQLINAYRKFGHTQVKLDPFGLTQIDYLPELDCKTYGIADDDMDVMAMTFGAFSAESAPLRDLISFLKRTYANRVGVEFEHIESLQERIWFQRKFEQNLGNMEVSKEQKIAILDDMIAVDAFEHFIHTKFPGEKRFSIEGGESTIVAIKEMLKASARGMEEMVIAMAHRGRLSILTRIIRKPYYVIFAELMGASSLPSTVPGDVKYHMGASHNTIIDGKNIYLSIVPNPSHLESVNTVALGRCRAKQDLLNDTSYTKVLPLLIHGDASVSGQGCVMETLALSQLMAYHVGGTIHIIVNNMIGFTTNNLDDYSTRYCSNIAKFIDIPVLHINGNDPEAILFAANLATEYRYTFHKDIFIDIVCYRKYGHNEGDEPLFTQPITYKNIQSKNHRSPTEIYRDTLIGEGVITSEDYDKMRGSFVQMLEEELATAGSYESPKSLEDVRSRITSSCTGKLWQQYFPTDDSNPNVTTGVPIPKLVELGNRLCVIPSDFDLNSKIARQLDHRAKAIANGEGLDWSVGESLAYATILDEGYNIRFTGEDVERGTFSHRHAVLTDQENEDWYTPLNNLDPGQQGSLFIHNSNLSEFGVLGFEYGYSAARPNSLTIWEGQFGDFANGAQVIIDQYIASSEAKWLYMSGLVILLPHGNEGQGPEHTSARIERYLQMCAMDNMRVCNCTTPASFFHVIRRQIHAKHRKPLIVFTPKSLLRHKLAVSKLSDMADGTEFIPVIDDTSIDSPQIVKRLILCSGKVYYDLVERRQSLIGKEESIEQKVLTEEQKGQGAEKSIEEKNGSDINVGAYKKDTIAVVRLEQLYPFPSDDILVLLAKYKECEIAWCQEEHENMGAYSFVKPIMDELLAKAKHHCPSLKYVGRQASASPSTGFAKVHAKEQNELLSIAMTL